MELARCHYCRHIVGEGSNEEQAETDAIRSGRADRWIGRDGGHKLTCYRCQHAILVAGPPAPPGGAFLAAAGAEGTD